MLILNVKAVVAAFNQEKALVGAFSVIVKTDCETDESFYSTILHTPHISSTVVSIKLHHINTVQVACNMEIKLFQTKSLSLNTNPCFLCGNCW